MNEKAKFQPMDGRITAAICVKNGEKTIAEAVRSLCNQTVLPACVLVVNDGSTDRTVEKVRSVISPCKVDLIENEGRGLYDGRSTALKNCNTEFLAFIDADCEADRHWIERILEIFRNHPEVAAGTGAHPQIGDSNFTSRLHRLWFIVEGIEGAKYTEGVVGANSYFRTGALRKVGGWVSLPLGNAEDFYISIKLKEAGYKMWIDDQVIVHHHYTRQFSDLMRKSYNSGYAITVLMKLAGIGGFWYWYTLSIPLVAGLTIAGLIMGLMGHPHGWGLVAAILFATFIFNLNMFKKVSLALPRWGVRWVIIWGYSLGILKAIVKGPPA